MSTPLASAARRVRHEEDGFSLVELMVTVMIGTIIIAAAFGATTAANRLQNKTAMRIDAVNRGRNAMESITAGIRSQQCFNSVRPMVWAADTGMEFYASSGAFSTTPATQALQLIRLEWRANAGSVSISTNANPLGDIVETVWDVDASGNAITGPAQPSAKPPILASPRVTTLAQDVERAPNRRNNLVYAPFFQYYDYSKATGSGRIDYSTPSQMVASAPSTYNPGGLASAPIGDLPGIVLVEVNYRVTPRSDRGEYTKPTSPMENASQDMDFYNTVSVRIADPTNPAGSPQCL